MTSLDSPAKAACANESRASARCDPEASAARQALSDAMLEDLATRRGGLASIARRHALSLADLAARIAEPGAQRALRALAALADERASLRLATARIDAADALRRLALDDESKETARKACVDLLRLPTDAPAAHADRPSDDGPGRDQSRDASLDEALLRWLERIAREDDDAASPEPGAVPEPGA